MMTKKATNNMKKNTTPKLDNTWATIATIIKTTTSICPLKKTSIGSPKSKRSWCSTSIRKDRSKIFLSSTRTSLWPVSLNNTRKVSKHLLPTNLTSKDFAIKSVTMSTSVPAKSSRIIKKMFKWLGLIPKNILFKPVTFSWKWTKKGKSLWTPITLMSVLVLLEISPQLPSLS